MKVAKNPYKTNGKLNILRSGSNDNANGVLSGGEFPLRVAPQAPFPNCMYLMDFQHSGPL